MSEWSCWCWTSVFWSSDWEEEDDDGHECPKPFQLPAPLPDWPPGTGFATGMISLGEIELAKVCTFEKVWSSYEGGEVDKGATFYKPTNLPPGFFSLGHYGQPNCTPLEGWVLVAKESNASADALCQNKESHYALEAPTTPLLFTKDCKGASYERGPRSALAKPLNYALVWSSDSWSGDQDGYGYFWLPCPPEGYRALGFVVTNTEDKPSVEEVRCVRLDLTEECEIDDVIWSSDTTSNKFPFCAWNMRPSERGMHAQGICVGTCYCNDSWDSEESLCVSCLKNATYNLSAMPNLNQVHALMKHYGPTVFFHPEEVYMPSSVRWFFENGALLYRRDSQTAEPVTTDGSNLPPGGSNDGKYWLALPDDGRADEVKRGNLESAEVYVHVKPMLGGTFTDIAMWIFCPFNGPVTAKIGMFNLPLGRIGEHVSDWEHFTLRICNFTGQLWRIYFSQHSGGEWVNASDLEYIEGNKAVVYSSKNGHASFPHAGDFLQGDGKHGIGIRNDAARSDYCLDASKKYKIIAAEYMHYLGANDPLLEPFWLQYMREWGPTIVYDSRAEIYKIERYLPRKLRHAVEDIFNKLPNELGGEEGPTGPKEKDNWEGDERS
uniref:Vacuolar protein sorting-associated protein 62 n=1 Tax=Araucaria cunninghamii TaxID=56994 RepID=A0A0D6R1V8_ARACU